MKGAGFCSLYQDIHYIEVHYNKIWVYLGQQCNVFPVLMLPIKQKWSGSKKNVGPYLLTIQKNPNTGVTSLIQEEKHKK